jgi:steroid 5-alpha reductase family enzyme
MLTIPLGVTMAIATFVSILFILSLSLKRNDIADVAWGPGIVLASWSAWYLSGQPITLTTLTVLGLVSIWATRLGIRIYRKNKRKGEDARYARWRAEWGQSFYIRSYLQVYLFQGALMIVVGYSTIHASINSIAVPGAATFAIIGGVIWFVGFIFEVVGDYQLDAFLKNPENKGRLMRYGLWHYSRHPNYFGEVTMWWGIWLIVLPLPLSAIALISPLTITGLILFVSGIPLLETGLAKHPEFPEYKRTTSVFIPWWPKL